MLRLDLKVANRHLARKYDARLVKQAQRHFCPKLIPQKEAEVNKFIETNFIQEVKYSTWISNIVLVNKKNKQIRVCINFHDLNNVCLKDGFPLPLTKLMVDAIIGHEALSFMDGSSRIIKFECLQEMKNSQPFALQKGFFTIKSCILG